MAPRNQYRLQFFFRKGYVCADVRWRGKTAVGGVKEASHPILVAHSFTDTLLLFVAPSSLLSVATVGNLSPSLFLNPTALSHHVGGPVRAIAAPHTATQVMWESRGLRPAVTYHILLPFGAVDRRSLRANKKTCSGNQTITCCCL